MRTRRLSAARCARNIRHCGGSTRPEPSRPPTARRRRRPRAGRARRRRPSMSSTGATQRAAADLRADRAEQELARVGDAAADDDALGPQQDDRVRQRAADELARARECGDRGLVAGAGGVGGRLHGRLPGGRGDRLGARHPVEAAAVAAAAQRAVGIDRRVPDLARVAEPEVQAAADHHAAADAGAERDADEIRRSAPGAEAQLGERERAHVVDQRDRRAEPVAHRFGDRRARPSRRARFGSSTPVPVAASKCPGSARPAVAAGPTGATVARPSAATRSSTASSPRSAAVGHASVASTRRASSTTAHLTFVPPRSSPTCRLTSPSTRRPRPARYPSTNGASAR